MRLSAQYRKIAFVLIAVALVLGLVAVFQGQRAPSGVSGPAQQLREQTREERKELLKQVSPSGEVLTEEERQERKELLK